MSKHRIYLVNKVIDYISLNLCSVLVSLCSLFLSSPARGNPCGHSSTYCFLLWPLSLRKAPFPSRAPPGPYSPLILSAAKMKNSLSWFSLINLICRDVNHLFWIEQSRKNECADCSSWVAFPKIWTLIQLNLVTESGGLTGLGFLEKQLCTSYYSFCTFY